ncbi:MAG: winged helix-turn-helix transcriptional regulator [Bacteroidetes bacterium]|nr:winged helix-turn-helix transcriptional regulator [Bacteroidota bacterium]
MLKSLITSKTRIKLLLKFFLNSENKGYLRNLEQEFGESTNAIRVELNRLEQAGLLTSEVTGNRKYYQANIAHPLFGDINSIVKKFIGIDQLVEKVTSQIGDLEAAYITGDFARGIDSKIMDLVLIGNNLDTNHITHLIKLSENMINRKVRSLILTANQMKDYFEDKPALLIWKANKN